MSGSKQLQGMDPEQGKMIQELLDLGWKQTVIDQWIANDSLEEMYRGIMSKRRSQTGQQRQLNTRRVRTLSPLDADVTIPDREVSHNPISQRMPAYDGQVGSPTTIRRRPPQSRVGDTRSTAGSPPPMPPLEPKEEEKEPQEEVEKVVPAAKPARMKKEHVSLLQHIGNFFRFLGHLFKIITDTTKLGVRGAFDAVLLLLVCLFAGQFTKFTTIRFITFGVKWVWHLSFAFKVWIFPRIQYDHTFDFAALIPFGFIVLFWIVVGIGTEMAETPISNWLMKNSDQDQITADKHAEALVKWFVTPVIIMVLMAITGPLGILSFPDKWDYGFLIINAGISKIVLWYIIARIYAKVNVSADAARLKRHVALHVKKAEETLQKRHAAVVKQHKKALEEAAKKIQLLQGKLYVHDLEDGSSHR